MTAQLEAEPAFTALPEENGALPSLTPPSQDPWPQRSQESIETVQRFL